MMRGTASKSTTVKQFREFCGAVVRCLPEGIPPSMAQRWIQESYPLRQVLEKALLPSIPEFPEVVELGIKHLETLIKEAKFDEVYEWRQLMTITDEEAFVPHGLAFVKVKSRISLVTYPVDMHASAVLQECGEMGIRMASIAELLQLAIERPNLQHEGPIFALTPHLLKKGIEALILGSHSHETKRTLQVVTPQGTPHGSHCRYAMVKEKPVG